MLNDVPVSPHFRLLEFEDPDTRLVKLEPRLLVCLEALRDAVGKPIRVTSGYRSVPTNARVGGAGYSYHLRGMAADLVWEGIDLGAAVKMARAAGFTGIGIDRHPDNLHLHVDVRVNPAYWEE